MLYHPLRGLFVAGVLLAGLVMPAGAAVVTAVDPNVAAVDIDVPGATLDGLTVSNSFSDFWNFNLIQNSLLTNVSATNAAGNIPDLQVALFTGINGTGTLLGTSSAGTFSALLTGLVLGIGTYSAEIFGTAPSGGSTISGTISLQPVPLPGALALFGSGLVGLIALGRKRKRKPEFLSA